jgi:hypothetical protein
LLGLSQYVSHNALGKLLGALYRTLQPHTGAWLHALADTGTHTTLQVSGSIDYPLPFTAFHAFLAFIQYHMYTCLLNFGKMQEAPAKLALAVGHKSPVAVSGSAASIASEAAANSHWHAN